MNNVFEYIYFFLFQDERFHFQLIHIIYFHYSLDPAPVEVHTLNRDGLYDIEATVTVDEKDLTSPATFDCILRIPETNYTVRKSTIYYTGKNLY